MLEEEGFLGRDPGEEDLTLDSADGHAAPSADESRERLAVRSLKHAALTFWDIAGLE